jgi:hypothetical protein
MGRSNIPDSMNAHEAFAAIALVAVACDGSLDTQEAKALRIQLEGRSPYRSLSDDTMGTLFDGLLTRLRQEGWQSLLDAALPVLTAAQQETAIALAAQLIHCDRVVEPQERELLARMAEHGQLPPGRAEQIIAVIEVLNRDSLAS